MPAPARKSGNDPAAPPDARGVRSGPALPVSIFPEGVAAVHIVVCVKQVPDTHEMRIDEETHRIVRQDVPTIVNPYDEYSVEEGIRLKERVEGARMTTLCMGPAHAEDTLKETIARGSDAGVLLSDDAFAGSDLIGTARVLAAGIEKLEADLVILGKESSDGVTGALAPAVAETMGVPHITLVSKIRSIDAEQIEVERLLSDGVEVIKAQLPCVISVVKEINEPRLPSLRGVMMAKRAKITVWGAGDLGIDAASVGDEGALARVEEAWIPEVSTDTEMLTGDVGEQAKALFELLKDLKVI